MATIVKKIQTLSGWIVLVEDSGSIMNLRFNQVNEPSDSQVDLFLEEALVPQEKSITVESEDGTLS